MIDVTAVRRRRLSEEVAAQLEAMIRDGRFTDGDQLPSEQKMMALFGVGRPAIREALFSLQKMGLVATTNGARTRITRPTPQVVIKSLSGAARQLLSNPEGIRHWQQARALFEVGLARHAAEHATDADLQALRAALRSNREALDDLARFEKTDVAFHFVLATIPRNPIFTSIHEAIVEWLTEQRNTVLKHADANKRACRSHKRIHDAIVARDPDRAGRAMQAHLDEVSKQYWRVWRSAAAPGSADLRSATDRSAAEIR